jgi:hypothetical protein
MHLSAFSCKTNPIKNMDGVQNQPLSAVRNPGGGAIAKLPSQFLTGNRRHFILSGL